MESLNALIREVVNGLEFTEDPPSARLDRLTTEMSQFISDIRQGRCVIDQEAAQGLISRLRKVEELSRTSKHTEISQIFYQKICELEAKLSSTFGHSSLTIHLPTPSPDKLSLGPKYDNLESMWQLQERMQTPGFAVPRPVGISSPNVKAFLQECAPETLRTWNELSTLYEQWHSASSKPCPFLDQASVKEKISAIRLAVTTAFENAAQNPDVYAKLASPKELHALIRLLHESQDYAMVRSTGAEDTKAATNAGGNMSVPYVLPTHQDVIRSIGAVVASYFDIASLKNRLDAGEDNPFKPEKLQLAVLTQQLIGEPVLEQPGANNSPEDIPVSFVCFSNEPLYVGTEKFRIMRISATYGHGEGVVGTKGIPTDSWLITYSETNPGDLIIHSDIQKKTERLAPVRGPDGKVRLQKVPNPSEMAKRPALSEEQLRSIFKNAQVMEKFFRDPATDIEGVFKQGKAATPTKAARDEMLYFVQARPKITPPHEASYFDVTALEEHQRHAIAGSLQAMPLVSGRSNVIELTAGDQLLVADTLEHALKLYDKTRHRAVVIFKPSPALSHAVVNFSLLGVPCLLTTNRAAIKRLQDRIEADHPLEVCTQTATLYLWDQQVADPRVCLKPGFGKHPAKLSPSILSRSVRLGKALQAPPEIRSFLMSLRAATTHQAGLQALRELQHHPLIANVNTATREQQQELGAQPHIPSKANRIVRALTEYDAAVTRAFTEATAVFSRATPPPEGDRLERLFHAEVLEAVLLEPFQETPGGVGRCHLMHVPLMSEAISALISYQKDLPLPAHFADLLLDGKRIPNPDPAIFTEWEKYLDILEGSAQLRRRYGPEVWVQFKEIMSSMRKSGVLPMWFMFYFKPGEMPMSQHWFTQWKADAPLLAELNTQRLTIKHLSEGMDRFAHPETFEEAWRELEKAVNVWSSDGFCDQIKAASSLVQNIACQTMERLVTTLDTAVKTMKVGAGFTDQVEQTRLFKRMLVPYCALMEKWALKMVPHGALPTHFQWPIGHYVETMNEILHHLSDNDPQQLLPSRGFSVNAAALGTTTAFDRHFPRTLEDILTLAHQNLLVFLSALTLQSLPPRAVTESNLPTSFKSVLDVIETSQGRNRIQRIGLTVTENEITYRGNYPLQNHSAQLELIYEKSAQQMTMKVHFMGDSRIRWNIISEWVEVLDSTGRLSLESSTEVGPQELSFAWNIDPNSISQAMAEFFRMGEATFAAFAENIAGDTLSRLIPQEENPENTTIVKNFLNYCSRHPGGEFPRFYITKACRGPCPGWIFSLIPPAAIQGVAKKLLIEQEPEKINDFFRTSIPICPGLDMLRAAFERGQITRNDIADVVRVHLHRIPESLQREAVILAEGPHTEAEILPNADEITSDNLFTQLSALYRLERLIVQGDPQAAAIAQNTIQRLLAIPLKKDYGFLHGTWEAILCALMARGIANEEAAEWCSRTFPNPTLRDALCKNAQHALLWSKVIAPLFRSDSNIVDRTDLRSELLSCLNSLIEKDIGTQELWQTMASLLAARPSSGDDQSFDLLSKLIKKGFGMRELVTSASCLTDEAWIDPAHSTQPHYKRVYEIRCKEGIEKVLRKLSDAPHLLQQLGDSAAQLFKESYSQKGAVILFRLLLELGHCKDIAQQTANDGLKDADPSVRAAAEKLQQILMQVKS